MRSTTPLDRDRMVATTRRVDDDPRLLASLTAGDFAFWHDGAGIVARGVAGRVPAARVGEVLSGVESEGAEVPGTGPVAVGALPFAPALTATATMVIPAWVWRRDAEGCTWLTVVSRGDAGPVPGDGLQPVTPRRTDMIYQEWAGALDTALRSIGEGAIDKVVLARQVTVEAATDFSIGEVVQRLRTDQPGCYVFAAEGLVGASPELLVERHGARVRSRPMAGTSRRNDEPALVQLEASSKDRREHALVVDTVVRRLEELGLAPVVASSPHAEPFSDLAHIVTDVVATVPSDAPSALELALALHPTPAVAGTPAEAALALISRLEAQPRGRYGGPVGWVDGHGDGEFAVALRCAEVRGNRAVLYAGAGIVAGSTSQGEWRETETKLEAMRRALAAH